MLPQHTRSEHLLQMLNKCVSRESVVVDNNPLGAWDSIQPLMTRTTSSLFTSAVSFIVVRTV
jgi:hypothetical protein